MEHSFGRNVISFLLVFVLTVFAVTALSRATTAEAETASDRYSQEVRAIQTETASELSAPIREEKAPPLVSVGAFFLILAIPGTVFLLLFRSRKSVRKAPRSPGEYRSRRNTTAYPRLSRRSGVMN